MVESTSLEKDIWTYLHAVEDPEVPVLSILDLGIVRKVELVNNEPHITITPTYTGCPAMDMIEVNIKAVLQEKGIENVTVKYVVSPPWTTDWMSEEGKRKLKEYGIAPPIASVDKAELLGLEKNIPCPQCDSTNSEMISHFGSTACKSLYRCKDCLEPFDYFKCH